MFLDAVHYAPHGPIDVAAWDCDFLACSAYKFFGPHVGILWGRRELLEELPAYKVRPAPNDLPGRWMTGTQSHEGIAGVLACIDYLASGKSPSTRRPHAPRRLDECLSRNSRIRTNVGDDVARRPGRTVEGEGTRHAQGPVPTVAITVAGHTSEAVAHYLAERGIYVWHGNFFAQTLVETLSLGSDGLVRLGLLHYNTSAEVERLLTALGEL